MTMPSNTCTRRRWPSITWKCTRTVSPALKRGTLRSWARSIESMTLLMGKAARRPERRLAKLPVHRCQTRFSCLTRFRSFLGRDERLEHLFPALQDGIAVREQDALHRQVEQREQRLHELLRRGALEPALGGEPERLRRRVRLRPCPEEHVPDHERLLLGKPVQDLALAGGRECLDPARQPRIGLERVGD